MPPWLLGLAEEAVGAIGSAVGGAVGGIGDKKKRRRRRGIPRKIMADTAQIKALLGAQAAKEVLVTLLSRN